jgi:hypothetical protein
MGEFDTFFTVDATSMRGEHEMVRSAHTMGIPDTNRRC